jgi:hypothetical protein
VGGVGKGSVEREFEFCSVLLLLAGEELLFLWLLSSIVWCGLLVGLEDLSSARFDVAATTSSKEPSPSSYLK